MPVEPGRPSGKEQITEMEPMDLTEFDPSKDEKLAATLIRPLPKHIMPSASFLRQMRETLLALPVAKPAQAA